MMGHSRVMSWSNNLRPRLFMERLPVQASPAITRRIEVRTCGSCMAKSAKPHFRVSPSQVTHLSMVFSGIGC